MNLLKIFSKKNLTFFAIILLPFDQVFTSAFSGFSYWSPLRILTIFLALFFFQYKIKYLEPFKSIIFLFYAYCALAFISVLWSKNVVTGISYSAQLLIMLLFTIVAVSELVRDGQIVRKLTFYGSIFGGIMAVLCLMGFFSAKELNPEHRLSFTGIGINAVAVSIGFAFLMGISYLFLKKQKRINIIIVLVFSLLMFYFLIRTGTRSAIIGALISLGIAYLLSFSIKPKYFLRFALLLTLLFFVFNYIIIEKYVSERIATRIVEVSVDDLDSRFNLWQFGINWYSNNIFGAGAGNEEVAYHSVHQKEAHNIFVSSLIQLGIPGFLIILFVSAKLFFIISKIKNSSYKFVAHLIYFFLIMQMMKGTFLQNRIFWIPLIIIMTIVIVDRNFKLIKTTSNKRYFFTRMGSVKKR